MPKDHIIAMAESSLTSVFFDMYSIPRALRMLKMTAPNGKKGKIVGLTLNYNANGSVENLIVETYGKNAGTHYVDLEDFEFSALVAKKMSSKP